MFATVISIQDAYINRVNACQTKHYPRTMRAARKEAEKRFAKLGYSEPESRRLIDDARDMAILERRCADLPMWKSAR